MILQDLYRITMSKAEDARNPEYSKKINSRWLRELF